MAGGEARANAGTERKDRRERLFVIGVLRIRRSLRRPDRKPSAIVKTAGQAPILAAVRFEADRLEYGLQVVRERVSGILLPVPTRDGAASLSRLADLSEQNFSLGEIGLNDTLEFTYDYFARPVRAGGRPPANGSVSESGTLASL